METKPWGVTQTSRDLEFIHPGSGRRVPVREYMPEGEPRAWVLFSVGFGGQSTGYGYLARHWASQGLACFVIEHVGSNLDVLKSFPQKDRAERHAEVVRRVQLPEELEARPKDLELVYREFSSRFAGLPLGLGGHSYGTYTVLAGVGLVPRALGHVITELEPSSLLLISPQPPGMLFTEEQYRKVEVPSLVLTGTEDHLLNGSADYRARLRIFQHLPEAHRHQVVLRDTEHMAFAGVGLRIEEHLQATRQLTAAWWHRTLSSPSSVEEAWESVARDSVGAERIEQCV